MVTYLPATSPGLALVTTETSAEIVTPTFITDSAFHRLAPLNLTASVSPTERGKCRRPRPLLRRPRVPANLTGTHF